MNVGAGVVNEQVSMDTHAYRPATVSWIPYTTQHCFRIAVFCNTTYRWTAVGNTHLRILMDVNWGGPRCPLWEQGHSFADGLCCSYLKPRLDFRGSDIEGKFFRPLTDWGFARIARHEGFSPKGNRDVSLWWQCTADILSFLSTNKINIHLSLIGRESESVSRPLGSWHALRLLLGPASV
jgi:hypothetical protein